MSTSAFNRESDVAAMREEIVNRRFRVKMIGMVATLAMAALAVGALFFMPVAAGPLMQVGAPLVLGLGSGLVSLLTYKESERLKIDEQYLESRMQGGNWGDGHWRGYRTHVAEPGHAAPTLGMGSGYGYPGRGGR